MATSTHRDVPTRVDSIMEAFPPALRARFADFAYRLPDAQAHTFLDLVQAACSEADRRCYHDANAEWDVVMAHVPGMAVALNSVRAHIRGMEPPECPAQAGCE